MELNPFKKRRRQQDVMVVTEDDRIVEEVFPVDRGHVEDDKTREAYFLDNAALVKHRYSNFSTLVVSERSAVPIYPGLYLDRGSRLKILNSQMTTIACEHLEQALEALPDRQSQDRIAELLKTTVLILAVTFAVIVVVGLLTSGKLHFPI